MPAAVDHLVKRLGTMNVSASTTERFVYDQEQLPSFSKCYKSEVLRWVQVGNLLLKARRHLYESSLQRTVKQFHNFIILQNHGIQSIQGSIYKVKFLLITEFLKILAVLMMIHAPQAV